MQTVLVTISLLLLGITVTLGAFAAAMRSEGEDREGEDSIPRQPPLRRAGFFMNEMEPDPSRKTLWELEEHIRRERAAAEEFLKFPTGESLHAPGQSPAPE